jgi:D-alanyl-D-alanine carboxypeptidase/D-alanyl-D-alanine-endopeptidase (penicillin-binding protein 4)
MRRPCSLLALIAALLAAPARADAPAGLAGAGPVAVATWSAVIVNPRTHEVRVSLRPEAPVAPASVLKLLTSVVALKTLGPGYRFHTRLLATGPVADGLLRGDLVLAGGGDPTLTRSDLAALARAAASAGVQAVTGNLLLDGTLIATPSWEPGWVADDLTTEYGHGSAALDLADALGATEVDPAGGAFVEVLREAGIEVAGAVRSAPTPAGAGAIADHPSRPLGELLIRMNKESLNPYAEALFRTLGAKEHVPARSEDGSAALTRALGAMGVATDDIRVVDGSGLSRYDLVTTRAIAQVLSRSATDDAFVQSLPVAGEDGTLARRFTTGPLKGRLRAKTGTMSSVSALAGYLDGRNGDRWVVVVIANGFIGSVRPVQAHLDRWLEQQLGSL